MGSELNVVAGNKYDGSQLPIQASGSFSRRILLPASETDRRFLVRKLTLLAVFCFFLVAANLVSAQQVDAFIGGGTLLSPEDSSSGLPPMKGGLYINLGGDLVLHNRFGFNVETAWRGTQAEYIPGIENYRPILTDFNFLFQPRFGKKVGVDLLAGIGAGDVRFYAPGPSTPGYANYVSTDHFMEHLGGGIRYYVWHHVFVRPEVHYYHIQGNNNLSNGNGFFSSNNVVRVGASIGYTFGGD
jgi:opacity protein-like surface antigen